MINNTEPTSNPIAEKVKDKTESKPLPRRSFLRLIRTVLELGLYGKIAPIKWKESGHNFFEKSAQTLGKSYLQSLVQGCIKAWEQVSDLEIKGSDKWLDKVQINGRSKIVADERLLKLEPITHESCSPTEKIVAINSIDNFVENWYKQVQSENDSFRIQQVDNPKQVDMKGKLSSVTEKSGLSRLSLENGSGETSMVTDSLQAGYTGFTPLATCLLNFGEERYPQILALGETRDILNQTGRVLGRLNLKTGKFLAFRESYSASHDPECFPLANVSSEQSPFVAMMYPDHRVFLMNSGFENALEVNFLSDRKTFYETLDGSEVKVHKMALANLENRDDMRELVVEFGSLDKLGKRKTWLAIYRVNFYQEVKPDSFGDDYGYAMSLHEWDDDFERGVDRVILGTVGTNLVFGKVKNGKLLSYQISGVSFGKEVALKKPIDYSGDEQISVGFDQSRNKIYLKNDAGEEIYGSESKSDKDPSFEELGQINEAYSNSSIENLKVRSSEILPPPDFEGPGTLSEFDLEATGIYGANRHDMHWEFSSQNGEELKPVEVGEKTVVVYMSGLGLTLQFSQEDKTNLRNYLIETYDQCLGSFLEKKYKSSVYAKLAFDNFLSDTTACANYAELLETMKDHQIYFLPWIIAAQPNPLTDVERMTLGRSTEDWDLDVLESLDHEQLLYLAGIEQFQSADIPSTSLALQTLRILAGHKPESVVFLGHSGGANALNSLLKIVQEGWADELLENTKINGAILFGRISFPEEFYDHVSFILSLIQNPKIVNRMQKLLGFFGVETSTDQAINRTGMSYLVPKEFVAGIDNEKLKNKVDVAIDVVNPFDVEQVNQIMIEEILKYAQKISEPYIEDYLMKYLRTLDIGILQKISEKTGLKIDFTNIASTQIKEITEGFWSHLFSLAQEASYFPYPASCSLQLDNSALEATCEQDKRNMYRYYLETGWFDDNAKHLIATAHTQLPKTVIRACFGLEQKDSLGSKG